MMKNISKLAQLLKFIPMNNQSHYLNHSNKASDWLIVACFVRVWSMLMTLLFTLKRKFVLKIESDTGRI